MSFVCLKHLVGIFNMSAEQRYTKEEMDKRDMFACTVLAALVGTPELRGIH